MSAIAYSIPKGRKKRKSAPRESKLMEVEGECAKMSHKNQKKKIFKLTASFLLSPVVYTVKIHELKPIN